MKNYDLRRPHGIRFARHAMALDETRADFPRVGWGWRGVVDEKIDGEPDRFVQMWFAGNHSDIGGSYPEEESRLSDIALRWMVDEATAVPDPLIVDATKLNTFPSAAGMQHCEVDAMRDSISARLPRWLRKRWHPSWKEAVRTVEPDAPVHPTVEARLALAGVLKCGRFAPYRPVALGADPRFSRYYKGGGA